MFYRLGKKLEKPWWGWQPPPLSLYFLGLIQSVPQTAYMSVIVFKRS